MKEKYEFIQGQAKNKINNLLEKYNVSYIDYDAKEDEYTICLDKDVRER